MPSLNTPQALDLVKGLILYDSWPLKTSNSAKPFCEKIILPFINRVKSFFFEKLFFSFAIIGFSGSRPSDLKSKGYTKNLKHAAVEIGFPGKPKKQVLFWNFANIMGFPGLIFTSLKILINL